VSAETDQERGRRHYRRTLFDGVAQLYAASRRGYPAELVDFVVTTAGLAADSAVLEVGCGPGQLTEHLARYGFNVTAIDIGPSMVAAARRRLAGSAVSFQVTSFEDFTAAEASFDLICSGTAFHWVDPEVKFSKPARLLRPGGWLALLATEERFDDPLGAALSRMWAARSDDTRARTRPAEAEIIADSGWFDEPVERTHAQRMVLPTETVIGVENTRAIVLSWPEDVRQSFTDELRHYLRSHTEVPLTQLTSLTMARVLEHSCGTS
jgi:2-polyprenyl-3-methyl-5-hydroxy-6-metoxy-1,4-benzoquinol methylase